MLLKRSTLVKIAVLVVLILPFAAITPLREAIEQAFAVFYTGTIGGGALAPVVFGHLGDIKGVPFAVIIVATTLLLTLPLSWYVQKGLDAEPAVA